MENFKRFDIPPKLLEQLNEFSYGGFLLFTFDNEGAPRYYAQFDNELNMMALQKSSEYWLEGVHDLNSDTIKAQMCGEQSLPPKDDMSDDSDCNDWDGDFGDEDDFSS